MSAQHILSRIVAAALVFTAGSALADPQTQRIDFSNGEQGWVNLPQVGDQGSWIEPSGGVAGTAGWRTRNVEAWGLTWRTSTNPAFVGDYTSVRSVTLSVDMKANAIVWRGANVARDVVVELRDYDNPRNGAPYNSVWFNLGPIDATQDWQHLSVTIRDTSARQLPRGWRAYTGTEDFKLPKGVTFADMLKGVDEIVFTTYVPGYLYDFTYFDVSVDNIEAEVGSRR